MVKITQSDIDYVNHEKDEYLKKADATGSQGNEIYRLLSGQLVLVAGMIISFSAAFSVSHAAQSIDYCSKVLLVTVWVSLSLSIAAGITGHLLDVALFKEWQSYYFNIANRLGTGRFIGKNFRKVFDNIDSPKTQTPLWPLYAQITLLVISGLCFLLIITRIQLR